MRSSTIKNNFTSGELTPLMYGRTELEPYQKGLAECLNMRVLRHGGVTRRNGTRFVTEVKDSTKKVRLIPFIFSDNQSYMLEVGEGYIRFLTESGYILGGTEFVTNGTFDTGISGWTSVSTGTSFMQWNSTSRDLELISQGGGEQKARQTLTGFTVGVTYQMTARVNSVTDIFSRIRIGTSLGAFDIENFACINGILNGTPFVATQTTYYFEVYCSITGTNPNQLFVDDLSVANVNDPAEVLTSYTEAELFEVMYAQSNDIMWLVHKNHPPLQLKRIATDTFRIAEAPIIHGPFAPLTFDSVNRVQILSSGVWTAGTIGSLESEYITFSSGDVGSYFIIYDDSDLTVHEIVLITGYTSEWVVSVEFLTDIAAGLQASYQEAWALQGIGDEWGYPAAVALHDQRLIYAGTAGQPQNVRGSTVADFDTFSVGTNDDDHFDYVLATTKYSEIFWLAVKHDLIIGTISNEWAMRGGGLEDPITPSNVVTRPYRSEGSIRVQPDEVNDLIVFVQRAGHKIIGLSYSEDTRSLNTTDLMLLAEHLTVSSIVRQLSYQSERESVLWCVTSTGQLLGMTYDASQAILAWHQHTTGASGEFESVATVPVSDADQTWVVVKRTINGSVVRNIERLDDKDWRVDDDPYYVDSGISYNGLSATVMTGLDHLEGEEVVVYASGEFVGEYTVASGQITLDNAVTQAHIGLDYLSTFTELPEGSNSQDGSAHTRQKRKAKVDLRLYKTQGIIVNGDVRDLPRDASTSKPELFTGIIDSSNLGWDKDAANTVSSIGPNPLTVLAIRSTLLTGQE